MSIEKVRATLQAVNKKNIEVLHKIKKKVKLTIEFEAWETYYVPALIDYIEVSVSAIDIINTKYKQIQ